MIYGPVLSVRLVIKKLQRHFTHFGQTDRQGYRLELSTIFGSFLEHSNFGLYFKPDCHTIELIDYII